MKTCPVCDTPYPALHSTCPTDGAVLIESHELAPGHLVRGKYRILRKLGQGGMGVVYEAEHLLLGGHVALKFLAPELGRSPQFVKKFRNEARAAYQLKHPNIVEVLDLDQDEDGSLFIAMEYLRGHNLRSVLNHLNGPFPVQRALDIAGCVAAGLAAAHERGAVHRDIKPENILLAMNADGKVEAKILDFGIAVMKESVTTASRTQGLLLTPEYAAPEQWRGMAASELDGRTDLYALGTVLYEMLTGKTPFHAVNAEGWMFQHLQGTPLPPAKIRPELARDYPWLEPVVLQLLAREREDRLPSAKALLEVLATRSTKTHPPQVNDPSPSGAADAAAAGQDFTSSPFESAQVVQTPVSRAVQSVDAATQATHPVAEEKNTGSTERSSGTARPGRRTSRGPLVIAAGGLALIAMIAWVVLFWSKREHRMTPQNETQATPKANTERAHGQGFPLQPNATGSEQPANVQASQENSTPTWKDPVTGLTWTKSDNGSDLSLQAATGYCNSLRLSSFKDWRLPTINELQAIFNSRASVPGTCCGGKKAIWHVKGDLKLTGAEWSSSTSDSGTNWDIDFDAGKRFADRPDHSGYMRALCVRSPGVPGGQSQTSSKLASVAKVNLPASVAQGLLVQRTAPVYPPVAVAARVSGTVVLNAIISERGTIEDLHIASGPALLQQAAMDAVKTWRYTPYLLNGKPVKVTTTINVVFTIRD